MKTKYVFLLSLLLLLVAATTFVYVNLNRLVSEALIKTYHSKLISEVYELQFEKLRVNLFEQSIQVIKVKFFPKAGHHHTYINSTIKLETEKISLLHVQLIELLKNGTLQVDEIKIIDPTIEIVLDGASRVYFPYSESKTGPDSVQQKKLISGFKLKNFQLQNANFHGKDILNKNEMEINQLNLSFNNMLFDQQLQGNYLAVQHLALNTAFTQSQFHNKDLKKLSFNNFSLSIDSLESIKSLDTLLYSFKNLTCELNDSKVNLSDSVYDLSLKQFRLNYLKKNLQLNGLEIKQNWSDDQIQKKFKYQKVNASGSVEDIKVVGFEFDSLIYYRKLVIREIVLDKITAYVFKDKLKELDPNHFPDYPAQSINKIKLPLTIQKISAHHLAIINKERKPDNSLAKVELRRGEATIENISNQNNNSNLKIALNAYINNKVPFRLNLNFEYEQARFTFNGKFNKFNLQDLNPLIIAYTPAKVHSGIVDGLTFSGTAEHKNAKGNMMFLYHELKIDLQLQHQNKWTNSGFAFAANTLLPSSNPSSQNQSPKTAYFYIEREMHRGFINVVLKSLLNGIQESLVSNNLKKAIKQFKTWRGQLKKK